MKQASPPRQRTRLCAVAATGFASARGAVQIRSAADCGTLRRALVKSRTTHRRRCASRPLKPRC